MADTEPSKVTVPDHQAHPDEPGQKKVDEELQVTKPEDVTPLRDTAKNGDMEKPKSESNTFPDTLDTKIDELATSKMPEPPALTEVQKDQRGQFHGAEPTVQELPQVEKIYRPEAQELTGDGAECKIKGATAAYDVTEKAGEKLATEAVSEGVPEVKVNAKAVESGKDGKSANESITKDKPVESELKQKPSIEPVTEAAEKVKEEKTPIQKDTKEQMETPVDAAFEKVPEDELVSGGIKFVADKKVTGEAVERVIDDKATKESITKDKPVESESALKPSVEPVDSIQEKVVNKAVEEVTGRKTPIQEEAKYQMEYVDATAEKELESTSAVEVIERVTECKPVISTAEEVKTVTEEKSTSEFMEMELTKGDRMKEKKDEAKTLAAAVSSVVEKEPGKTPAEKATLEPIETIQDEQPAVNKAMQQGSETPITGGKLQDQEAVDEVDKPEGVSQTPGKIAEKTAVMTKEAAEANVTEQSLKDDLKLPEKVEEYQEKNNQIEEKKECKNFKLNDLIQDETNEAENASSSETTTKVAEKSSEGEQASRDIDVAKEKTADAVEAALASADACKEKEVSNAGDAEAIMQETKEAEAKNAQSEVKTEEKVEAALASADTCIEKEVSNAGDAETIMQETKEAEAKNAKSDVKTEEKVQADVIISEAEKESHDVRKPDNSTAQEVPSENVDTAKESQDQSTKQVPEKSTQKQSNSILSKVKKSIVKVKKALVGKPPSSKNISTEA